MNTASELPIVTGAQMAAVDRAMVEICGLELVQVMEVAGRAVAVVARHLVSRGEIAVLCGSGGNGGDAFVAARYLAGWGFDVGCWLARPSAELRGLAAHNLQVCQKLGIQVHEPDDSLDLDSASLIIDGIFGFGLSAAPAGRAAQLIEAANAAAAPILAIDVPSGVDATTGAAFEPAVTAQLTVTLGLPKWGLLRASGPAHAGTVIVADIGIPAAAYAAAGIPKSSIFDSAEFATLDGRSWPT